jgi:1,4-alpha-glucan branching enzyme
MQGQLALVLHAHLPFVRHPEHETFLEESWLYEAVAECYLPLLRVLAGWERDGIRARLALTLSPTLCAMLRDPLLRSRCARRLDALVELAEKETHRTHWDDALRPVAEFYHERLSELRALYAQHAGDLVAAFAHFESCGLIEIITCAATHGLLPLMSAHPESIGAQLLVARDHHRDCFGRDPRGIWLPECAYAAGLDQLLREAGLRWFVVETHGLMHATPRPLRGVYAPVITPAGVAAFGRDPESARQVWSRDGGYTGDPRYREFYRDIGHDLDFDYVRPYLPSPELRGFTGIKYHRITGATAHKEIYRRDDALAAVREHARHFVEARAQQIATLANSFEQPPIVVCPYDAELFGHCWFEGPEFLDAVAREAATTDSGVELVTPGEYLQRNPTQQIATPASSSWGEGGHLRLWLNETNAWIFPHLEVAQMRMTALARRWPDATRLQRRALDQAARELLLAQSSDWPFILRTGTSAGYARQRVKDHLLNFLAIHEQLTATKINETWLEALEARDNLFPAIDYRYWK